MANWKVTIRGTGQNNGTVPINKTVEIDENAAKVFNGPNRYQAIEAFVQTHYPGVSIDPKKMGVNVNPLKSNNKISKGKNKSGIGKSLIGGAVASAIIGESKTNKSKRSYRNELSGVMNLLYNNDIDDVKQKLDYILVSLSGYKWDFNGEDNNKALNQCLKQYKLGLKNLKNLDAPIEITDNYKKKLKKLRWKKFFNLTWMFLILIGIMLALYIWSLFE